MFIRATTKTRRAWTLPEMMVGVSVFSISGAALATIFLFCLRSFAALTNYAVLDQYNRQAMDQLTREIRQSQQFVDSSSNATTRSISIINGDGTNVTYTFDSGAKRLTRNAGGISSVLLSNCNLLDFNLYTRPPSSNSFDNYPVPVGTPGWQSTVKMIQLTWKTSISICPTARVTTEDVQTARIVIRK